jgi:hypothetical protein
MLLLLLVSSKIGLWMGATPERLLKAENKKFFYYGNSRDTKKSWFGWEVVKKGNGGTAVRH